EVWAEGELLVHDGDGEVAGDVWVGRVNPSVIELDFAFVRDVNAGENLSERAFARAVFADERMATAAVDGETYAIKRQHAGEAFGDLVEDEERHGCRGKRRKARKLAGLRLWSGQDSFVFRVRNLFP